MFSFTSKNRQAAHEQLKQRNSYLEEQLKSKKDECTNVQLENEKLRKQLEKDQTQQLTLKLKEVNAQNISLQNEVQMLKEQLLAEKDRSHSIAINTKNSDDATLTSIFSKDWFKRATHKLTSSSRDVLIGNLMLEYYNGSQDEEGKAEIMRFIERLEAEEGLYKAKVEPVVIKMRGWSRDSTGKVVDGLYLTDKDFKGSIKPKSYPKSTTLNNKQTNKKENTTSQDAHTYTYKVAGVSKDDRQVKVRAFQKGEKIRIVREKNNPHDPYAVALKNQYGSMLGYIPKEGSEKIATLLDNSVKLFGYVANVHGGYREGYLFGFTVDITTEQRDSSLLPSNNPTPFPKGDTSAVVQEFDRNRGYTYEYFDEDYAEPTIIEPVDETYDPIEDEWIRHYK